MTAKDWNYTGDMNLEYGGLFWKHWDAYEPHKDLIVEAVEVVDLSSAVGGPDNMYMITKDAIHMPREQWADALKTCGYELRAGPNSTEHIFDGHDLLGLHTVEGMTLLVDAFNGYKGLDNPQSEQDVVQIGKLTEYDPEPKMEPTIVLRGNWKLANYVRKHWL
jgi:hypothetical protein